MIGSKGAGQASLFYAFTLEDHIPADHLPGYIKYKANIQLITDNLLDLSHISFDHLNTLDTSQTVMSKPVYQDISGGVAIERWDIDSEPTRGIQFTSIQTPETADTTHYFWTQARDFRVDDEELTERIHAQLGAAFEDDRIIFEAQQEVLRQSAGRPFVGIQADAGPMRARRLIRKALDAEEHFA